MPDGGLYLGLDIGTSGARAVVIDDGGAEVAGASKAMGEDRRDPVTWWAAARAALDGALDGCDRGLVRAISVDGTSGTMLPVIADGTPVAPALMYNDACKDDAILSAIDHAAPADSAARGASSALARALALSRHRPAMLLHQADWIAGQLSGRWTGDANNALKTGYDAIAGCWPDWIAETGLDIGLLPPVVEPGTDTGPVSAEAVGRFGLDPRTRVVAGTTDGCASFLATAADRPGEGVTALGTTMTIKLLSDRPVSAPEYGIYSHRLLGNWLVGGASNTGGNVLLAHFDAPRLAELSAQIDAEVPGDLDYYPLTAPGERFPIADPDLPPRLTPRPEDDADFLKAMFEGIARIEAMAYRRLAELGAPALTSVRSVGGGSANEVWAKIRTRHLGVPMVEPASAEAAYGSALLARRGVT